MHDLPERNPWERACPRKGGVRRSCAGKPPGAEDGHRLRPHATASSLYVAMPVLYRNHSRGLADVMSTGRDPPVSRVRMMAG